MPPQSENDFVEIAASLIARVELPATTLYRLAGVGLSNFRDADEFTQPELFN
ncbi:MAG TPA: hypothetical protein VFF05_03495 [Rudaea sp.]|nr:hypothetical protein [Rudaea sp.]